MVIMISDFNTNTYCHKVIPHNSSLMFPKVLVNLLFTGSCLLT